MQERPVGLCDALFRGLQVLREDEDVLIGLPDTVWFPPDGFNRLPAGEFSFLLFPVDAPERFDAVVVDAGEVTEIQVKWRRPSTNWVWGAFRLPGATLRRLYELWTAPERGDEYVGSLVNAYLARGGRAFGIAAGERYFDIGTVNGYRAALEALRHVDPIGAR